MGPPGVWGVARDQGTMWNRGDPSAPPLSRQGDSYKPKVKSGGAERPAVIRGEMQTAMEQGAGIYRTGEGLLEAAQKLRELQHRFRDVAIEDDSRTFNTELTAVLELSSFQLRYLGLMEWRPDIAVVTNFAPNMKEVKQDMKQARK